MADHWYSGIVGTVVLPVAAIGIIALVVGNYLFGFWNKAVDDTKQIILKTWDEYNTEYQQFAAKGSITDQEYDILKAKLGIIKDSTNNLSGSIPNINSWIGDLIVAGLVGAIIYWAGTGKFHIGQNLNNLINRLKNKPAHFEDPYFTEMTFLSTEEIGQLFNFSSICLMADQGNVQLASTMWQAEQARYSTNLLPSMQVSYQMISAQIPLLQGGQLLLAQLMLATYNVYFTMYPTLVSAPPLFDMMPPLV